MYIMQSRKGWKVGGKSEEGWVQNIRKDTMECQDEKK